MNVNDYFDFTKTKNITNKGTVCRMRTTFLAEGRFTWKPLSPQGTLGTSTERQIAESFPDKHKSGIKGSICKVFYLKF